MIPIDRAFAVGALIATTCVGGLGLSCSLAQAETTFSYIASRIDTAFEVAADMPPVKPMRLPMAVKGDLLAPFGCSDVPKDEQSECVSKAYDVPSQPSVVIATRFGNTTTLMRVDTMTERTSWTRHFGQAGSRRTW